MTNFRNAFDGISAERIDFTGIVVPAHMSFSERLTLGAVTVGRCLLSPNPGMAIGAAQYVVALHEGKPFDMEWRLPESSRSQHKRMVPGDVQIHPAGRPVYKRWHTPFCKLFVAIEKAFVERVLREAFDDRALELPTKIGIRDPVIDGIAAAWRMELQKEGAGGRLYAESLATALLIHLFRNHGTGNTYLHPSVGGLAAPLLRRVTDYIEAHFVEDVSLGTLAGVAGLSTHYFSDMFKVATGVAPHQFLIERRIHHAKELLLESDIPIAQLAVEVGFSGQSHFTEHFRKLTGTTPWRFRQAKE